MKSNPDTELFDVVDEHDNVLHQETRTIVHRDKLLHRAVHILVFNSKGELYLQRRSMLKDQLPGVWTTSCSGHVDAGESYDVAAFRELEEELSISLPSSDSMELLFKHPACKRTGWEFIHVYRVLWDGEVHPDPDEISEGQWILPHYLDEWISTWRRDFAPSFRLVWEHAAPYVHPVGH